MVDVAEGQKIAEFIDQARRRQPKLSVRAAADVAGISEGWWRQLVAGFQRRGETQVPVVGSPDTYMAMAHAVGVATQVHDMLGEEAPDIAWTTPDTDIEIVTETTEAIRRDPSLNDVTRDHLLRQYAILRDWSEGRSSKDNIRPETPAGTQRPLRAVARKRPPQDRT